MSQLNSIASALLPTLLIASAGLIAREVEREAGAKLAAAVSQRYGPSAAYSKFYVGTDVCIACHTGYSQFKTSMHYTAFKTTGDDRYSLVVKEGVVADYDLNRIDDFKQGLDFNKISSAFDRYKPNAPILGFSKEKGYTIKVGELEYRSQFSYGGSGYYKQRWVAKIPVVDRPDRLSASFYVLPVQYNEATRQYVTYNPQFWYDAQSQPLFKASSTSRDAATLGNSFDKKCAGCHFTGIGMSKTDQGEYVAVAPSAIVYRPEDPHVFDYNSDGEPDLFTTGCERCHGPGSVHVITVGDPKRIINPGRDLTPEQINNLCTSCHVRGVSKGAGTFEFPMDEGSLTGAADAIGEDITEKRWTHKPGRWPDNTESRQHHQQGNDYAFSAHSKSRFGAVGCNTCHNVHNSEKGHIREAMIVKTAAGAEITLKTAVRDNTQCLACHAGHGPFAELKTEDVADVQANRDVIARVVSKHTFHSYRPEGPSGLSRCTECHMANMASSAIPNDISSHTFDVVPPSKTIAAMANNGTGMPNGCAARCHKPLAPFFGLPPQPDQSVWNSPADRIQSEWLTTFYGPSGTWWQRK